MSTISGPSELFSSIWSRLGVADDLLAVLTAPLLGSGLNVGQAIIGLFILTIAVIFRGILAEPIIHFVRKLAENSKTRFDDKLVSAIRGPVRLLPVAAGVWVSSLVLELSDTQFDNNLSRSLIAIMLFWLAHNIVTPLAYLAEPLRRALTSTIVDWLLQALRILFILVGAAAVLQLWGIPVAPVIAGLGIFGVAVALGAQDFFKNVIAGLSILIEKRFEKGEWIQVEGVVDGICEKIGFRSTLVRRFDKAPVYVPNTLLADNPVTNFTRMTQRRIFWKIGVEYTASTAQIAFIRDGILNYLNNHDAFEQPPTVPLFVFIDSFNASSIDIMIYCFTKTTVWGEWLAEKEKLAILIKEVVDASGTGFAFPSQTTYIVDVARYAAPAAPEAVAAHWQDHPLNTKVE
jgi:MscS family membrane protein